MRVGGEQIVELPFGFLTVVGHCFRYFVRADKRRVGLAVEGRVHDEVDVKVTNEIFWVANEHFFGEGAVFFVEFGGSIARRGSVKQLAAEFFWFQRRVDVAAQLEVFRLVDKLCGLYKQFLRVPTRFIIADKARAAAFEVDDIAVQRVDRRAVEQFTGKRSGIVNETIRIGVGFQLAHKNFGAAAEGFNLSQRDFLKLFKDFFRLVAGIADEIGRVIGDQNTSQHRINA